MTKDHEKADVQDAVRTEYDRQQRRRRRRMIETSDAYIDKAFAHAQLTNTDLDLELVAKNALWVATNGKLGDEPAIEGASSAKLGA